MFNSEIPANSTNSTHSTQVPLKIVPIKDRQLSQNHLTAIKLLAQGYMPYQVCQHLQIAKTTLCKWQRFPAFRVALDKAKSATIQAKSEDLPPILPNIPAVRLPGTKPPMWRGKQGPISLEKLDSEAMKTLLERIQLGDGKVSLDYAKARGLLKPVEEHKDDSPIPVQFGQLPKDDKELEDIMREVLPPVNLSPTFKPKTT